MVFSVSRKEVRQFGDYIVDKIHEKMAQKAIPAPKHFLLQEDQEHQSTLKRLETSQCTPTVLKKSLKSLPIELQVMVINKAENIRLWLSIPKVLRSAKELSATTMLKELATKENLSELNLTEKEKLQGVTNIHKLFFFLFQKTLHKLSMTERANMFYQLRTVLPLGIATATRAQIITEKVCHVISSTLGNRYFIWGIGGTITVGLNIIYLFRDFIFRNIESNKKLNKTQLKIMSIMTITLIVILFNPFSSGRQLRKKLWKLIKNNNGDPFIVLNLICKIIKFSISRFCRLVSHGLNLVKIFFEAKRLSREIDQVNALWQRYVDEIIIEAQDT
jgi:hypothetical protein